MGYADGETGPEGCGWLYEYKQNLSIHSTDFNSHSQEAEISGERKFGRKGKFCLSQVLDLPNAAIVDFIHQILLGVTRKLLRMVTDKFLKKKVKKL